MNLVSRLESTNYDHRMESIVPYLDALGADLEFSIRMRKGAVRVTYEVYLEDEEVSVPHRRG